MSETLEELGAERRELLTEERTFTKTLRQIGAQCRQGDVALEAGRRQVLQRLSLY